MSESEEQEIARLIADMDRRREIAGGSSDFSWVYGIQSAEFIKIGVARDVEGRMYGMQIGNPIRLRIVMRHHVSETRWIERRMHKILREHSVGGEWFRISVEHARSAFKVALSDMHLHIKEETARLAELERLGDEKASRKEEKDQIRKARIERILVTGKSPYRRGWKPPLHIVQPGKKRV